jgi:aryl-phospho-beta-D-glucosidase BglC (GH1 family)
VTPASAGALYKGTATLQSAGPTLAVEPAVVFYGSGGQILTAVFGQFTQVAAGSWTTLVPVLGIAPTATTGVIFGVIVASNSPGQTVYLEYPVLTTAPAPGAPRVVGPLSTAGNEILQGNGSPLVTRGVNLSVLQASSTSTGLSENTILQMKAWGANTVRVPLNEDLWLATSCAYSPSYAAEVSQVVNWITALGMVAVVELNFDNPADIGVAPGGTCPPAGPQIMADPASVTFWSQVAALFAANPLVAFDLYNEPHDISDQVWLNGGTVNGFPATGMQQLYNAVRSAGASNLVVGSGNNWANTPPSTPIAGTTIAYAAHAYTCPNAAPPNCASTTPYDPSTILDNWVQFSSAMPVIVSEFGWPSVYDGTYNATVIAFAQAHGWGWLAFAWTTTQPWGLLASTPVSGPDQPAPSGMPVLAALGGIPWP